MAMRMYDVIEKKRDGRELSDEEIRFVVNGFTLDTIKDYQMSAFLMAVYLRGMTDAEVLTLTMAMRDSGDKLDLSAIRGVKVDKHSTGGVGDKVSLVLGPMVAACGVPVAKMSGRGLGHTGGTIDKLESIPGFNTTIPTEDFIKQVNDIGISLVGQTKNLAPADKKIYALRDVTATVSCIPLIASSIMSKKLASGADSIVLDVKVGDGAFMKDLESAKTLAKTMVKIGEGAGKKTVALVTNMDEPLGCMVGNNLEVIEAINCLLGKGPKDVMELCYELGSYMLLLGGRADTKEEGKKLLLKVVESGQAFNKLKEFVAAQGGDISYVDNCDLFEKSRVTREIYASCDGFINRIKCENIGKSSMILGGGRETKESVLDLSVGVEIVKKVGEKVSKGDIVAKIYGNSDEKINIAERMVTEAFSISSDKIEANKMIQSVTTIEDI